MNKKLDFSRFMDFLCFDKKVGENHSRFMDFLCFDKKVRENHSSWACLCRIEQSYPRGRNITRDSASHVPG